MRRYPQLVEWACYLAIICQAFVSGASAGTLGIYDADKDSAEFSQYPVNTVFVPPQVELIAAHKAAGRQVFLTLEVFGGSAAWQEFPDARPVGADGAYLEPSPGGICPTHAGWRQNRLELIASWLKNYNGDSGIDGIWLDFLRYPGRWERQDPILPESCYCPRCLGRFQDESGIRIGEEAKTVAEKAAWIRANALLPWTAWKKEQIVSFARDARRVIEHAAGERKILLGAFVVPFRKSDFAGAISFHLAQDAKLLAPFIDVFSPMVYHRMVERPVDWVGELSDFFAELTGRAVWPIIQAGNVGGEEFGQAVQSVARSSAEGLLAYKFSDMKAEHWQQLAKYQERPNLLPNPSFSQNAGGTNGPAKAKIDLPDGWYTAPRSRVQDSKFWYRQGDKVIGLTAGLDRRAVWSTSLPACRPGTAYLFTGEFFREDCDDGWGYPEVVVWGREYRLNTHRMADTFQTLKAVVSCPEDYTGEDQKFQFRNSYPGNSFFLRSPKLVAIEEQKPQEALPLPEQAFFPVGVYGASAKNLREIRETGFDTAVLEMTDENVDACLELGMRCTLAVPHDSDKLIQALDTLRPKLQQGQFLFYVNDEPEIHSFPAVEAEDIQRIIKQRFPGAATNMAIVRPQAIPFYAKGADYFMLDQYPVPNMPMAWLAESMDEAASHVGRHRLQSVIQAFGDERHAAGGWPRLPTYGEMKCLALLSVIHGSRGIYFFTYPGIAATEQGKNDIARLVRELNSIKTWLLADNDEHPVTLRMTSPNRVDPRGNPAVHCTRKEQHGAQMLICVNTLGTYTEAEIDVPAERQARWRGYYGNEPYLVVDGNILARFDPYEAKILLESK